MKDKSTLIGALVLTIEVRAFFSYPEAQGPLLLWAIGGFVALVALCFWAVITIGPEETIKETKKRGTYWALLVVLLSGPLWTAVTVVCSAAKLLYPFKR